MRRHHIRNEKVEVPEYQIGMKEVTLTISLKPEMPENADAIRQRLAQLHRARLGINQEIRHLTGGRRPEIEYECQKCGHWWRPYRVNRYKEPRQCPNCGSIKWAAGEAKEPQPPQPVRAEELTVGDLATRIPEPIRVGEMAPPPRPTILPMTSSRTWRPDEPEPQPERTMVPPPVPEPTTPPSPEPQEVPHAMGTMVPDNHLGDRSSGDVGSQVVGADMGVSADAKHAASLVDAAVVAVPASEPLTPVERTLSREDLIRLRQRRAEILKQAQEEDARGH